MSYQSERDEFLSLMVAEGIPVRVSRALLREATVLQRLAELECSSERAYRDRVPCPAMGRVPRPCICDTFYGQHSTVPRIAVTAQRAEQRVRSLCAPVGIVPRFGGDPRGCVLAIIVPSGRTNTWGQDGIAVPARGYSAALLERIG